jgi:hypothetical protein
LPPELRRKFATLSAAERDELLGKTQRLFGDKNLRHLILQSPEFRLAEELCVKLLIGSQDLILRRPATKGGLQPLQVAQFLASLAYKRDRDLPRTVQEGLRWLGIKPMPQRRGRPRGRLKDADYLAYVQETEQLLAREGIHDRKAEMKRKYPTGWQTRLRGLLVSQGWYPEVVDFIVVSKTLRSCAVNLAARRFNVSYDAVAKACRRENKTAKN